LTPLSELVNLKNLYLSAVKVTDLTPLSKLVHIKELILLGTKARQSDVEALGKKLPHTRIIAIKD